MAEVVVKVERKVGRGRERARRGRNRKGKSKNKKQSGMLVDYVTSCNKWHPKATFVMYVLRARAFLNLSPFFLYAGKI